VSPSATMPSTFLAQTQPAQPTPVRSPWKWIRVAFAYLPLLALVPVLLVGSFYPDLFTHVPLAALVALMAVSFLAVAAHVDTKLTDVNDRLSTLEHTQRALVEESTPVLRVVSLGEGFELLRTRIGRVNEMRVFAASSKDIFSFTSFHSFQIQKCHLLVRGFEPDDLAHHQASIHTHQVISDWRKLQAEGRVGELMVRSYDFLPTEFQVILDNDFMLAGLYSSDPTDYREVTVLDAVLIDGKSAAGEEMILEYTRRFDSLFETCATHHGSDVYNEVARSGA
jgi:hypothetical protein